MNEFVYLHMYVCAYTHICIYYVSTWVYVCTCLCMSDPRIRIAGMNSAAVDHYT